MSSTFTTLENVMLLYQAQATKSTDLPIIPQRKRAKKLLFLDIGLVNHQMNIHESYLKLKDLNKFYRGRIAEQVVGQNILAQYINTPAKLFYWAKEKEKSSAEIDFCLNKQGKILGIEVKSGKIGKLKSLYEFVKTVTSPQPIRIYSGELKKESIKINNKTFSLLSLPFYLTPRVLEDF